ncbi:MAG: hypothetical protein ACJ74O_06265 [Frankiaceae bacterium]
MFQFKHYRTSLAADRSRVLRDLPRELRAVHILLAGNIDNYLLITSVPFSGTIGSGSFDKIQALKLALKRELNVNVDLWDGLEISALLLQYPRIAATFFEDSKRTPEVQRRWSPTLAALTSTHASALDDETFYLLLSALLGSGRYVFGPDSDSELFQAYLSGEYLGLQDALVRLNQHLRHRPLPSSPEAQRAVAWVVLTNAAVAARIGKARAALRMLGRIRQQAVADSELAAWILNVESIALGKLDRSREYRLATDAAIRMADAAGHAWIAKSALLRELHKINWAANEQGIPVVSQDLEAAITDVLQRPGYVSEEEREHLLAQSDAYLALHYTWQPYEWPDAERSIYSAETRFKALGDVSETTRMTSERGRLYLLANEYERAQDILAAACRQRVLAGEYPRARYDLLWLGQAYSRRSRWLEAEICFTLTLSIHDQIYRGRKIDASVITTIFSELHACEPTLLTIARRRRLRLEDLAGWVASSTRMSEEEAAALFDLQRLRHLIAQLAA